MVAVPAVNLEQVSLGFSAMHVKLTVPICSTAFFVKRILKCFAEEIIIINSIPQVEKSRERKGQPGVCSPQAGRSISSHTRLPLYHHYLSPLALDAPHKNKNARASYLLVFWSCQYCCLATRLQNNLDPSTFNYILDIIFLHSTDCGSTLESNH